jgi:hypothetical protein
MIAIDSTKVESPREVDGAFVVHPMFDAPEEKRSGEGLGLMQMTPKVRLCLFGLRAYVFLMTGMLGYHLLDQAGVFHHH